MRAGRSWRARAAAGTAAAAVLCVLTAQAAPLGSADSGPDGAPYVVTFKAGTSASEQRESREEVTESGGEIHRTYARAVRGFAADLPPEAVTDLRADPDVRSVTPDVTVTAGTVQPSPPWNLDRVDQRSTALNNAFSYDGNGAGITVYILDSGIRADHVQFGGRVAGGFTTISDGNGTNDCAGHGTHVAGTVGASTYGVAKGVTLVPVRVLRCDGSGDGSGLLAGLDWVITHHVPGRSVINLSLGGEATSFIDDAVNEAIAAGIPVVAAAGNGQIDACGVSPARVPDAITVGAVDSADAKPDFSNFGRCLDLFAPGVSILSTYKNSSVSTAFFNGTSSAAPHVTGTLAVLLQGAPGASPAALRTALGGLFTTGGLTNIGAGSPNALLHAPPRLRLAGLGSATTAPFLSALATDSSALAVSGVPQIDAFATSGSGLIATQHPDTLPGCTISRPTSQSASRAALIASLSAGDGCVQFAQAEQLDLSAASPRLLYVPFASENVTYAVNATSSLPKNLTMSALRAIYRCEGNPAFRPMLPRAGSGLREFWIGLVYPGGVMPTPKPPCLQDGTDEFGAPIEPNRGIQVNSSELVPFSVPQWTGQTAGVIPIDVRGTTRIGRIDGLSPFTSEFTVQRDLYVVLAATAVTGSTLTDRRIQVSFIGATSLLCSAVRGPIGLRFGLRPHLSCGSTSLQTP